MLNSYHHVKISALTASAGSIVAPNLQRFAQVLDEHQIKRFIKSIGFKQTRHLSQEYSFLDLSLKTANYLQENFGLDSQDIDLIISTTQSPDSLIPCNSFILHKQMELRDECLNMDLVQGCAGFTYSLLMACNLIETKSVKKALVLVGDNQTPTYEVIKPEDTVTNTQFRNFGIFSTGCGACLLEYQEESTPLYFSYQAK